MNIIDIIVLALVVYAIWRGWSSGILVQLSGLLGVVAGAWLAFRFSERMCEWTDVNPDHKWLMFVAILIAVMIVVILLCRLLSKILTAGGLSLPLKLLGAAVSVFKIVLILALIMRTFENINQRVEITKSTYLKESISHKPLNEIANKIFPYIDEFLLSNNESKTDKELEDKIDKAIEKQVEKQLRNLQNNKNNE